MKMTKHPSWQYDELKQVGKNYGDPAEVEVYDSDHSQFRDVEGDSDIILDTLAVRPEYIIIDIGAGTGTFAIRAAHRCAKVYAVDVSQPMLDHASKKARDAEVSNIVFCHGGFLTYEHSGKRADAIVTCTAFHHLPDFWKGIALGRMNRMLKQGGQLYINDVIFEEADVLQNISRWIDGLSVVGGEALREDVAMHIKQEYSTFDWIMDGLLARSGFNIKDKQIHEGVFGRYLCIKESEAAQPNRFSRRKKPRV